MTPFRRRAHLRIAGVAAEDISDAEVVSDPSSAPPPPPQPRVVQAAAEDLQPDSPPTPTPKADGMFDNPGKLIWQGICVGVGYGLAAKALEMFFDNRGHKGGQMGSTSPRRKRRRKLPPRPLPAG